MIDVRIWVSSGEWRTSFRQQYKDLKSLIHRLRCLLRAGLSVDNVEYKSEGKPYYKNLHRYYWRK